MGRATRPRLAADPVMSNSLATVAATGIERSVLAAVTAA